MTMNERETRTIHIFYAECYYHQITTKISWLVYEKLNVRGDEITTRSSYSWGSNERESSMRGNAFYCWYEDNASVIPRATDMNFWYHNALSGWHEWSPKTRTFELNMHTISLYTIELIAFSF